MERRRAPCGDPQHILNNLLFDAANQALAAHRARVSNMGASAVAAAVKRAGEVVEHEFVDFPHSPGAQVAGSFAWRVDPRRALFDRPRLDSAVVQRVLGWAALGCSAGELGAMLAEDAVEVIL